jgi:hypothetical protein
MFTVLLVTLSVSLDDGTAVGPEVGKAIPTLKTFQAAGDQADKEIDWTEGSKDKPTVFVFIHSGKWDRPVARFLKKLDERVNEVRQNKLPKAQVAVVWLTKEIDKGKEYLPRAQLSLKLQASSWNVFSGEAFDAQGWVLSGDSVVNVIIVKDNKVAWGRAYGLANDETVKPVFAALTEEKK